MTPQVSQQCSRGFADLFCTWKQSQSVNGIIDGAHMLSSTIIHLIVKTFSYSECSPHREESTKYCCESTRFGTKSLTKKHDRLEALRLRHQISVVHAAGYNCEHSSIASNSSSAKE